MLKKCHDHLDSVHENYGKHLCFAASIGLRMNGGGVAVILHGLFPAVFQRTGSTTIFALHDEMAKRLSKQGHNHHHG
jgi:hypothetical protein